MASALVILIILIAVGYNFQKGGVVKSFGLLVVTICATIITFGYFEILANLLISKVPDRLLSIVPWLHFISFLIIFALSFALLLTILNQLTRKQIDFGKNLEHTIRIICGVLQGFICSGLILTALAIAPISAKYPYQRFDIKRPQPQNPKRVLLNPDDIITSMFGKISAGSFSTIKNTASFATLHPNYLNQLYLNRQGIRDKIPITSIGNEITTPTQNAAWFASDNLTDSQGRPFMPNPANNLIIVRIGIKRINIQMESSFTISQLRLICKPKSSKKHFIGEGTNIYPSGYLKTAEQIQTTNLSDKIELTIEDLTERLTQGTGKWINFVFEVPKDLTPLFVEFRQNSIAAVTEPVTSEKVSVTSIFIPSSECAKDSAEIEPVSSAKIYGLSITAQNKLLQDSSLDVQNKENFKTYQTENTIEPPQYENDKIIYVQAELKTSTRKEPSTAWYYTRSLKGIAAMLKPLDGYKLIALKCNNPEAGIEIAGQDLPTLNELSGIIHHSVGFIACGKLGDEFIYELDFCSVTDKQRTDGLVIAEDGSVKKPFPETIWITEKAEEILEFFVLYMVKPGSGVIITSVQPPDSQIAGTFKEYQGLMVK